VRGATFQDFSVHATGFSQWLMTNFLSAEFIRRLGIWKGEPSGEPNLSASCEVQCRNTATQNYSLFAARSPQLERFEQGEGDGGKEPKSDLSTLRVSVSR
jgi:hypothetical protein